MPIDVELTGGVAVITINRPERMNAMDADAYAALSEAWQRVRDDTAIRAAVVTGAGDRAFSTGADIKSFLTDPTDLSQFWNTQRDQLLNRGLEVFKPIIAAVVALGHDGPRAARSLIAVRDVVVVVVRHRGALRSCPLMVLLAA